MLYVIACTKCKEYVYVCSDRGYLCEGVRKLPLFVRKHRDHFHEVRMLPDRLIPADFVPFSPTVNPTVGVRGAKGL